MNNNIKPFNNDLANTEEYFSIGLNMSDDGIAYINEKCPGLLEEYNNAKSDPDVKSVYVCADFFMPVSEDSWEESFFLIYQGIEYNDMNGSDKLITKHLNNLNCDPDTIAFFREEAIRTLIIRNKSR